MKKLAGFLAFSLLGAGVITAQNSISTPIIATNGNTVEAQLQNTENALATDGDVIIKDRRDPPKRKENLVDTKIEALIQMDKAVATDGDVIIKDRRDSPKRKENLVDTKIEALIQMDNAVATDGDVIIKDRRKTKTEV